MLKKTLSFLLAMAMLLSLCQTTVMTASAACAHENKEEVSVLREGTCTVQGISKFECQDCHVFLYQVTGLKHTYGEGAVTKQPSCGVNGVMTYTCACGAKKTEVIPTTVEHNWVTSVPASCEYPAMTGKICSNCYATEGEIVYSGKALGHKEVKTLTEAPTCDNPGKYTITCEVCKKDLRTEVAPKAHTFGAAQYVEAACGKNAYTVRVCVVCEFEEKTEIPGTALKHTYTNKTPANKDATCTEKGWAGGKYLCDLCGKPDAGYATEKVPTNHDKMLVLKKVLKEATCKETGIGMYVCSGCGKTVYQSIDKAHKYDGGFVKTEATCTKNGVKVYTCVECKATRTEKIPATGHNMVEYLPATCDHAAYVGKICSVCLAPEGEGEWVGEKLNNGKGHKYGDPVIIGYVDCKTAFQLEQVCEFCGDVKTTEIAAGKHLAGDTVFVPAGCGVNAKNITYCLMCGEPIPELEEDLFVKTGLAIYKGTEHDWENGKEIRGTCKDEGLKYDECKVCHVRRNEKKTPKVASNHVDPNLVNELKAPTCEADGYGVFVCAACEAPEYEAKIPGGHVKDEGYVVKPATCEEAGIKAYNCTRCGDVFTEVLPKLDHEYEDVYQPATCESVAMKGKVCVICGDGEDRLSKVPGSVKLPHDYQIIDVEVKVCGVSKTVTSKCSACGDEKEESLKDNGSHNLGKWTVVPGTCEAKSKRVRECSRCSDYEVVDPEFVGELGKHVIVTVEAKEATCTEAGHTEGLACSVCGKVEKACEPVAKKAHDLIETVLVAPTCTTKGVSNYECADCDYVKKNVVTAKTEHVLDWDGAVVTKEANCVVDGTAVVPCLICNGSIKQTIKATGHVWGPEYVWTNDAGVEVLRKDCTKCPDWTFSCIKHTESRHYTTNTSCTEDGLYDLVCSVCGVTLEKNVIEKATDHNWVPVGAATSADKEECSKCHLIRHIDASGNHVCIKNHVDGKAPTCTEDGYTAYTECEECGKVEGKTILPAAHNLVEYKVAATCTKDGMKGGLHCAKCDFVVEEGEVIPATGHPAESVYVSLKGKDATCTEMGYTDQTSCKKCKQIVAQREVIPALDHDWITIPGKDATCTDAGMTDGQRCLRCGKLEAQVEIPALGHKWLTIEGKAPTCVEDGFEAYEQCSVCQATKSEIVGIPALGHTEVELEAKAATCTETGLTAGVKCSVCEETLVAQEEIPALGHTPVTAEGKEPTCTEPGMKAGTICEVCGEILEAEEIIPALGHKLVTIEGVAATCETAGKTAGEKCEVCGVITVAQVEIPAIGHSWKYKGAGRDADGFAYIVYVCANCGVERTVSYK